MRIEVHVTHGPRPVPQSVLDLIGHLDTKLTTLLLNQERIMAQNEEIISEVGDLNDAVKVIGDNVGTLVANLDVANARILELQSAGVAPETVALLKAAVDGAQEVAGRFQQSVDPNQDTPVDQPPLVPVDDQPAADGDLEVVVEPETTPTDESTPVTEEGVVAEDPASVESDENTPS